MQTEKQGELAVTGLPEKRFGTSALLLFLLGVVELAWLMLLIWGAVRLVLD